VPVRIRIFLGDMKFDYGQIELPNVNQSCLLPSSRVFDPAYFMIFLAFVEPIQKDIP
jgi:hypothetical protein